MDRSRARTDPRVLGLTGGIATGKSTVGDILLRLGAAERIDADRVVHELLAHDARVQRRVRERFGESVFAEGDVDRTKLGAAVFGDAAALRDLEAILHPAVGKAARDRLAALSGTDGVVIYDAVKLLQSELLPRCNAVWVVTCEPGVQRLRLQHDRGMTAEAAENRLVAQPQFHHDRVTAKIDNSGTRQDLERQVTDRWHELLSAWSMG